MNNVPKLKIGLLMDSFDVPYWIYRMIEKIQDSTHSQISLIIMNETKTTKNNPILKVKNNRDYFLYKIYTRLENKIYHPDIDAFQIKNTTELLENIEKISVMPKLTKYSDWINDGDVNTIRKYDLDVIIRLGFRILKGGILNSAKCGIWSFHHADNNVNRGGPAGFWEVFQQEPTTGSILQILNEDLDGGQIIAKSYSTTDSTFVKRNQNNYYMKSLSFLPRKLKELHEVGKDEFLKRVKAENNDLVFYDRPLYGKPKNGQFLKLGLINFRKLVNRKIRSWFYFDQWFLLFDIKDSISKSLWRYKKILPPKDRFWADPHVIVRDDKYFIFIEEYIYKKRKGHIALIEMDKQGNYQYKGKILEKSYHLSYPFVFEFNKNFYMIPESSSHKKIEIFKCIEFPNKWEFHGNLMSDIDAVDSTILFHNDKWWLFTGIKENDGASNSDELFLFYSQDPTSDQWIPHPQNPVISDVRRARPAGKIFSYQNKLYRPSQNSSYHYGYGININQIKKITEFEYEEEVENEILPKWDDQITRIHTFTYIDGLSVMDGKIRRTKL
jgi:hypothetical protein